MLIDEIIPYAKNARHNEKAVPVVADSIREFGLRGQIVLESREHPVIVTGHTRVAACKSLGWTEIPDENIAYCDGLKDEQKSGFKTATDGKVTNDFSYTARHEYGHLLQFQTTRNNGKSAATIRNEVQSIAKGKYGAKGSNPSRYGASNEHEYFAESFASMTGGKPNAHGKALSDWLKKRKK